MNGIYRPDASHLPPVLSIPFPSYSNGLGPRTLRGRVSCGRASVWGIDIDRFTPPDAMSFSSQSRRLVPALVGYLVGFAVVSGTNDIDDTVEALATQPTMLQRRSSVGSSSARTRHETAG